MACPNKDRKSRLCGAEMKKLLLADTRHCCSKQWDGGLEQINVHVL